MTSEPPAAINPIVAATPVSRNGEAEIDACIQQLRSSQDQTRAEALVQLGRLKAERATGPMVKALNDDPTPAVREAAARGLGLIGARSALPALQRAALQDSDRDVRHSASFAADVIRGSMPR
jgi:HEAT repeat protein